MSDWSQIGADHFVRNVKFPNLAKPGMVKGGAFKPSKADEEIRDGISVTACLWQDCHERITNSGEAFHYLAKMSESVSGTFGMCFLPRAILEEAHPSRFHFNWQRRTDKPFGCNHFGLLDMDSENTLPDEITRREILATLASALPVIQAQE